MGRAASSFSATGASFFGGTEDAFAADGCSSEAVGVASAGGGETNLDFDATALGAASTGAGPGGGTGGGTTTGSSETTISGPSATGGDPSRGGLAGFSARRIGRAVTGMEGDRTGAGAPATTAAPPPLVSGGVETSAGGADAADATRILGG